MARVDDAICGVKRTSIQAADNIFLKKNSRDVCVHIEKCLCMVTHLLTISRWLTV